MKQILFALTVIATLFAACTPESKPISISVDKAAFTESGSTTATKTMTSTITNTSSSSGTIAWDFSETTAVTGWTYTITVNGNAATGTSGTFDLAGSATATIAVTVNPNGNAGVGAASITLKDNSDSRVLQAIAYGHTAAQAGPSFSLSKATDSGTASASAPQDPEYTTVVTNLTASDLEITWRRTVAASNPSGWTYATCENTLCHAPSVDSKTYTITANGSFDLKAVVRAGGTTGAGSVTHMVFLASDSAATVKTFVATHTATF